MLYFYSHLCLFFLIFLLCPYLTFAHIHYFYIFGIHFRFKRMQIWTFFTVTMSISYPSLEIGHGKSHIQSIATQEMTLLKMVTLSCRVPSKCSIYPSVFGFSLPNTHAWPISKITYVKWCLFSVFYYRYFSLCSFRVTTLCKIALPGIKPDK